MTAHLKTGLASKVDYGESKFTLWRLNNVTMEIHHIEISDENFTLIFFLIYSIYKRKIYVWVYEAEKNKHIFRLDCKI